MKILHFYKTYHSGAFGGVEKVIDQIAQGTSSFGVQNEILSLSHEKPNKTFEVNGQKIHHCHINFEISSTPFSFSAISKFRQLSAQADIIHYHFPYPFADMLHFITAMKKPSLVSYHSDIVKQKFLLKLYHPLMMRFLSSMEHIVVASPNYLQSSNILTNFKNKTSIIPYGLEKKSYPKVSTKKKKVWLDRFGGRFFLFTGALRYYKGLHLLIKAAQNSNYPIVILGGGALEQELKDLAKKLSVNNIHFVGNLPEQDKVELLEACYAFVFPSHLRSEAFGISLLEAAMYGKSLISCEIETGTSYINIDKKTGLIVPPNDLSALKNAMDYIWNNPKKAEKMGALAQKRYYDLFTAEKMSKSYYQLYKRLIT